MRSESKFFDIRPGERFPLAMAALGTFSSIASVVLGKSLSDAILLSARPAVDVAGFFVYSSIALMLVSIIYFQLLRVLSATKLSIAFLLLSALGVIVFTNLDLKGSQTAILACATFLITAPALGNIIVWNAIGDAFNVRQGRRTFHLVSAASTLGGITSGFFIPILVSYFGITALQVADTVVFLVMTIPVIILRKSRRSEKTQISFTSEGGSHSIKQDFFYAIREIAQSPLLKSLSIIFFLTAIATNIIDFSFKCYLQQNYNQEGIATFYGYFNAVSNTFNLIVELTLLSQFLTRFRTRTLFAVTPLLLLAFSAPFIFVYSSICVIALRFMDMALRFTVQDAAREIAISPLHHLLRNRSKVVFKGVMNPLGGICAGIILKFLAPLLGQQYTPLLLIPITLITLYFVRDLNRFTANHLLKQLQRGSDTIEEPTTSSLELSPVSRDKLEYTPSMLMDDSPLVRDATIDAILLDHSEDLKKHTEIHRYAQQLVARETKLAQAALILMDTNSHCDVLIDQQISIDTKLQSIYEKAIYRMFKGLMALYRRETIQTIFQYLTDTRAATRAQSLELLQLTLSNCPYAKNILILCDDFSQEEKMNRLNDIERLSVEDSIALFDNESDRTIRRMMPQLTHLVNEESDN